MRRSVVRPPEKALSGKVSSSPPSGMRSDFDSTRCSSWAWSRVSCLRASATIPFCPTTTAREAGLPLRRGTDAERYEYLAAASAGSATVLTFARGDNAAQREQHPSRWFLEEASRLSGSSVYPSMLSSPAELASLREQPWFNVVASAQEGVKAVAGSQPADLHDYDLHHLWRWRQSGRRIDRHHLSRSEKTVERALRMERARNAKELTIWDGDLSGASSSSGRIGLSNRDVFSPTSLEMWATCPYRYFLSQVLGIAAPEQPEEIATISPLDRGSLVHAVLERFVQTAQVQGTIPRHDGPWTDDHRRLLIGIAEEEFREGRRERCYRQASPVGGCSGGNTLRPSEVPGRGF